MKLTLKNLWPMRRQLEKKPEQAHADCEKVPNKEQLWRDLVAYWILGLCTEIGYILMLCAAHDILHSFEHTTVESMGNVTDTKPETSAVHGQNKTALEEHYWEICAASSAGILLIADIVPAMLMNIICPFLPLAKNLRMAVAMALNATSFAVIANAENESVAIFGVILTSLALGIGEVTLLSYSAKFNKRVIPAWSSGTGAAGVLGSISYAALTTFAGMHPRTAMKIMLIIPVLEAITFWLILRTPQKKREDINMPEIVIATIDCTKCPSTTAIDDKFKGIKAKLKSLPPLLTFIAPLVIVFIFEYTCVSGFFEMIFVPDRTINFSGGSQYRWFLVTYQIGVFTSRTFGSWLPARNTWWAPVAQFLNVAYFAYSAIVPMSTNMFFVFGFVFSLGCVGGICYVHSLLLVLERIPSPQHKFSLGILTIAESCGIAIGGLLAVNIHDLICQNFKYISN